ncbi:MAG TPA: nitroreductase [Allosphingosinicella sp.]|nr:nitroreductase [Allosphingosinicella sp.]
MAAHNSLVPDERNLVTEAVLRRHSVRAFLDRPVERRVVEELLALAARAPSGGNIQPWHVDVLTGAPLAVLKARVSESFAAKPTGEGTEFAVYPPGLGEPWRSRRFRVGEQLYESIGVGREDRPARLRQFARNYDFFGAPVGLFFSIERSFGPPQWAHLGMFIQTIMLLAVERGLGSCAQEAWAGMHRTVGTFLGMPESRMLYCGMALGYPDPAHPINAWRSEREPVGSFAAFHGFD